MKQKIIIKSCLFTILCLTTITVIAEHQDEINAAMMTTPISDNSKSDNKPIIINLENRYYHSEPKESKQTEKPEKDGPISEFIIQNVEIISLVILNMILLFLGKSGMLVGNQKKRRTYTRTKTKIVLPPDCMREKCDSECEHHRHHPNRK